ncbi:MAG: sorbosone dehydrogenase family protein [Haloarculaceae archaeon]
MDEKTPQRRFLRRATARRRFLRRATAVGVAAVAGCRSPGASGVVTEHTDGDPTTTVDGTAGSTTTALPDAVGAERVADGFASPVGLEIPDSNRRFVVDQDGRIHLHTDAGRAEEPYLDVRDRMIDVGGYDERGLLGLAFHPEFSDNGRLFVRYSAPPMAGTPAGYDHTFVLSEFRADPNARTVDPDTERILLTIPEPQSNHNAGSLAFGPDGYLYVGVGDGGGGGDRGTGHVEDWYDRNRGGNGQDVTQNLLGSVLRIDVDDADPGEAYAVPEDNPLVGRAGLPEHYAWGFRNPWRFSFGPDGRLFVADVGQSAYEEVDVVEKGGNYGWNVREATHCYDAPDCPSETPDGEPLLPPVVEYPHGGDDPSSIAVIGGYLYDGDALPGLRDRYVFADWRADGRLFVATPRAEGRWPVSTVPVDADGFGRYVLSFGRDPAGELYVCTSQQGGVGGSSGAVFRLRAAS